MQDNRLRRASDEELYRRMRNGDRDAARELYERREPGLYRYSMYASGSRTIAEEVTQEVFLRLIGPGVAYDEKRGPLEAYLYGVARNLLRRRVEPLGLEHAAERASGDDPLGEVIRDERARALARAVRELPPGYRDVVVLCELEERSYEETARLMDCPVGTVRSRLHRARALLSAKLKGPERGKARMERRVAT